MTGVTALVKLIRLYASLYLYLHFLFQDLRGHSYHGVDQHQPTLYVINEHKAITTALIYYIHALLYTCMSQSYKLKSINNLGESYINTRRSGWGLMITFFYNEL